MLALRYGACASGGADYTSQSHAQRSHLVAQWDGIETAVIAGHMHRFRYDAPTATRPWAQIVGGGHSNDAHRFPTVISARVANGRLVVTAFDAFHRTTVGSWSYAPRGI